MQDSNEKKKSKTKNTNIEIIIHKNEEESDKNINTIIYLPNEEYENMSIFNNRELP